MNQSKLRESLFQEILMARQRVYNVRQPTPLEKLDIGTSAEVWVKREDQPPIYAYKWRGAYNRIATLSEKELKRGVVCASAGNHAQGVAIAAAKLGCFATIFMPRPTPKMKQNAVILHGKEHVKIELTGDTYDQAYQSALEFSKNQNLAFVHPYDDLLTMGGQGTLADEVVMSGKGPFDRVYLQIGGGGMAAAVACWLKHYMPGIHVVGVEAEGQASMKLAIESGGPKTLDELDIFCDGTAVQRTGDLTYLLCNELVDEFITVSNQDVSNAIRSFWNRSRGIVEPAGALGLAGLLSQKDQLEGQRVLSIMCGANMDFSQLAVIAADTGIGGLPRHHLRFTITENEGSLLDLMKKVLFDCQIVEFLYGKVSHQTAHPIIGFDAHQDVVEMVLERCRINQIKVKNVSQSEDVAFRVIPFKTELFSNPLILHYQFPERAGALHEFLEKIKTLANICYFNYRYTGENIGRAMIALEFSHDKNKNAMIQKLEEDESLKQRYRLLSNDTVERLFSSN